MAPADVLMRSFFLLGYYAVNVDCCNFIGEVWVVIVSVGWKVGSEVTGA